MTEGARVVVTDLEAEALEAIAGELGHAAVACAADVTDSAQVRAAVDLAVERIGGVDVAFANAGVFGAIAPVAEYPEDVFDHVMAVKVPAPHRGDRDRAGRGRSRRGVRGDDPVGAARAGRGDCAGGVVVGER